MPLYRLPDSPEAPFPPPGDALVDPPGLLAVGGDLHPSRLLNAYRLGIFPWFSPGEPILWWSPDPRTVFRTEAVHLPRRFRRTVAKLPWEVRADTRFATVIERCANVSRRGQCGSWIGKDMCVAYQELHRLGHAHSVEVLEDGQLVGGLYGVAIGRMFFGESMFSGRSGASRIALAMLARILRDWGWPLIDAQVDSPHLRGMGAESMPRSRFRSVLFQLCTSPGRPGSWSSRVGSLPVQRLLEPQQPPVG